jgi:hypothetical protein
LSRQPAPPSNGHGPSPDFEKLGRADLDGDYLLPITPSGHGQQDIHLRSRFKTSSRTMIASPYAVFFYGGPALVLLLIVFTLGAIFEHRRCRLRLATREELHRAEIEGFRLGVKQGYYRAKREQEHDRVLLDVDLEE